MKYIKIDFDEIIEYIELDDEGYATRQIGIDGDDIRLSCRQDYLAEGIVDTEEYCVFITAEDFNEKWNYYLSLFGIDIKAIKEKYPIGAVINGIEGRYYPQGTIIDINGNFLACDSNKDLSLHSPYNGIVTGYDEVNCWLLVEQLEI